MFTFSVKSIKLISIGYLALPVILFFIFWLKPIFSVPLIGMFCYSFFQYFKSEKSFDKISITRLNLLFLFLIITLWVFISGAGGWGLQSPDLSKHSSIFKDIIEYGTPTSYDYNGKKIFLSAYLGYYITVPILFGWLSWPIMMTIVTIWTFLGVLLGVIWFCILVNSFSPKWVLFFIIIGGLDIVGLFYNLGFNEAINVLTNKFYDILPFFAIQTDPKMLLLYQANTHSLFWGPQHALTCWIGTGIFFYEWKQNKSIVNSPIYLILLPFWSPFILMGLAPFVIYSVIKNGLKKYLTLNNILLIPVFVVIVWFVNSVPVSDLEKGLIFYKPERLLNYLDEIKAYSFFVIFEVIIWIITIYLTYKEYLKHEIEQKSKIKFLIFLAIILSLIPLYKLGKWNDFVQRVSMPALFILWILVADAWQKTKQYYIKIIFGTLLVLGSWDSLYHILFSLKVTDYKLKYTAIPVEQVSNFVETSVKEKWPIEQSFAPDSASFFKYMVR